MSKEIRVSAVIITDKLNRALMVRKRGTAIFMQPGGKPESGETPLETVTREVSEELGLTLDPGALRPLGTFSAPAANEPGHTVTATAFTVELDGVVPRPAAEIEEARWVNKHDTHLTLAPLSITALLPLVWGPLDPAWVA